MALLLATSAFAAANKASVQLFDSTFVGSAQLKPGSYTATWDGNGPDVTVNIMRGKSVVATVPARIVNLQNTASSAAAVVTKNGNGSQSLSEIRMSGKKYALAIGQEASKADSDSGK